MNAEEIARRYERRQGYDLIDYAEVALPVYRLSVDAVTMLHREIPPISEFVMRSVAAGMNSSAEVAGFLGLDQSTVDATLDQLHSKRYLVSDSVGIISLSPQGADVLRKARESSPQDETLVFLYDRLLLKPVRLPPEQILAPASVDAQKMIEIRPYPAEGPKVETIELSEVRSVLEEQAGGREIFGRDLLKLKRIARRLRVYRAGVALVFKKYRSSEIQIAFVVDDIRQEEIEHAFAERGGPKKMGFLRTIDESATASDLRKYLGSDVLALLPDTDDLNERKKSVALARLKHQVTTARLERLDGTPDPSLAEAVRISGLAVSEAEDELRIFPARPVAAYEPAEMLGAAMQTCSRSLLISSRTVDRSVVDAEFLQTLETRLKDGVSVELVLTDFEPKGAALALERLRHRWPNLQVRVSRKAQFYYLICDDRFALVTNRPFLGNISKAKSFHHVVGYLLQNEDLVRAFTDRVAGHSSAQMKKRAR